VSRRRLPSAPPVTTEKEISMNGGIFGSIERWFKQPLKTDGSVLNWILFVGVLIIAAFLWNLVLFQILKQSE
jgi:hypothetical protein